MQPVLTTADIAALQDEVKKVSAAANVKNYIVDIVNATRNDEAIKLGVSPRGSIALYKAAKAWAFINERSFITPDDVRHCAVSVLSHRIMLSPKGKAEYGSAENVIGQVISRINVPVE